MSSPQTHITIGDFLIQRLVEAGVGHVLGVPGDYNLQFIEQIVAHDGVDFVGTCNELNAAYATDGYARLNGSAALLTTYGVGELSAIGGVAGAYAEHVPVVCITGAPPLNMMENAMPLHHSLGDGNYSNMMEAFSQFTCAQTLITPQNAAQEIDRVISTCLFEKLPVYIQLPSNVSFLTIDAPSTPLPNLSKSAPESLAIALKDLTTRLENAKSPALLIDMDVSRLGLTDLIRTLVDKLQIPYASLSTGKAILSEQDPLFAGTYAGANSKPSARETVENSDCLISISPRFVEVNTALFTHNLPKDNTVILSNSGATIGHQHYEGVSARDMLEGVIGSLSERAKTAHPAPEQSAWDVVADANLTQARLWPRMARFFESNDVIIAESGTSYHGLSSQTLPEGAVFLTQSIWGAIGYTLPATLGASLAKPEKRHVLFIGDGSFQLTAQELSTLLRTGQKPIIFLLNNQGYTIERYILGMERAYNDVAPWNYTALPSAFGDVTNCTTLKAATEGELETALDTAKSCDTLCFIELALDPKDAPEGLKSFGPAFADFDYGIHGPRN